MFLNVINIDLFIEMKIYFEFVTIFWMNFFDKNICELRN